MARLALGLMGLVIGATSFCPSVTFAQEGAFECTDQKTTGWHFYCDPEVPQEEELQETKPQPKPEPEKPSEPSSPKITATMQVEAFREALVEIKNRAIIDPTPDNVLHYMRAQKQATEMASKFTDIWQRVLLETPDLDANLDRPLTQMGQAIYNDQRKNVEEGALRRAASEAGLLFVFEDPVACRLCYAQGEILKRMAEFHGVTVLAVSADGTGMDSFPDARIDNGHLENLGLNDLPRPLVAVVNPASNEVTLLGFGLLTEDQLLERIYIQREVDPGTRYQSRSSNETDGALASQLLTGDATNNKENP